ncbi:hypothetical protein [Micromonospora craterilacus]|uniref:hypothetical protein n=1 Tax=Micromonospora craterilacus TaxID=1655439 RepID=UPI0013143A4F|nr:hypothetical protein [Micromonospora craterilacus]
MRWRGRSEPDPAPEPRTTGQQREDAERAAARQRLLDLAAKRRADIDTDNQPESGQR